MERTEASNKDETVKPEVLTIRAMISLYCRGVHGTTHGLCSACAELQAYAEERIGKCPFGTDKPVCNQCTVHCYRPVMRTRVREVMRYAGPRMLLRHPVLAVRHMIRSRR